MKLYFLRHGESQANLDKVYAASDTPLTDRGRQQAQDAGALAKTLSITVIIASNFTRAFDTAKIVAEAIGFPVEKIIKNSNLRELGFGNLIGKPTRGLTEYLEHQANPEGDTNVESLLAAKERLEKLIEELTNYKDENILLVGHVGSGVVLQGLLTGDSNNINWSAVFPNAQIIEFPSPVGVL